MKFLALALAVLLSESLSFAAPCCSGSGLVPSLITTDSQAQVSARISQSNVVGSSSSTGSAVFHRSGNDESATNFLLSGAYSLNPVWQIHAEAPFSRRYRAIDATRSANWGAGDVSLGASFEAVQELRYNPIKPRVWLFADLTMPTGKSVYDSGDILQSDVQGRGAWSGTLGAFAVKAWRAIDAFALAEHRHNFTRTILGSTTALDIGAGYNYSNYRIGASLGPTWDSAGVVSADSKLVWTAGIQASALVAEVWSVVAAYSDQTLLGPTYNSNLSRALSLTATHRFE